QRPPRRARGGRRARARPPARVVPRHAAAARADRRLPRRGRVRAPAGHAPERAFPAGGAVILDPPETPETARSRAAEAKPRPAHAFRIGGVEIDSPFVLAPLAGVSDSPFRQLAREQGASAVYTEMVSSDGLVRGSRNTLDYCAFEAMERPIGIQVFGSDPDIMADAARVLNDMPAGQRPDLIDINMGCPVRKVVNRCAGAALLQDVPRIAAIVERMSAATPLPVTAKIRLGWDGNSRNVVEVARTLEAAGARAVAIHARTRAEKFEGQAHWDMIAE